MRNVRIYSNSALASNDRSQENFIGAVDDNQLQTLKIYAGLSIAGLIIAIIVFFYVRKQVRLMNVAVKSHVGRATGVASQFRKCTGSIKY